MLQQLPRACCESIDRGNETTTQLLTLLNVSATKAGKRKWILDDTKPSEKLNKRRSVQFGDAQEALAADAEPAEGVPEQDVAMEEAEEVKEIENDDEASQGMTHVLRVLVCVLMIVHR